MHFKTCQAFIYVFVNIFNEMIDSLSRLYGKGEVITAAGPLVSLKNLYKLLFVWIKWKIYYVLIRFEVTI